MATTTKKKKDEQELTNKVNSQPVNQDLENLNKRSNVSDSTKKAIADRINYDSNKKANIKRVNESQETNAKIDSYLDTSHRMNKAEKNDATNMVKDYFDNNEVARKSFQMQTSNPYRARKYREEHMSGRERAEYDKMSALNSKGNKYTEDITSFFQGAYNKAPFLHYATDKYDETFGYDGNLSSESAKENAIKQSPIANVGGQAAITALEYLGANELLGGIKGLDVTLNSPMASKMASSMLRGQIADTVLDTVPELVDDIKKGKSGKEIAKDMAINQGVNLAMNTLGGFVDAKQYLKARDLQAKDLENMSSEFDIPALLDKVTSVDSVKQAENELNNFTPMWDDLNALANADVVKKSVDTVNPEENLENLMKATNKISVPQTTQNITNLENQVSEVKGNLDNLSNALQKNEINYKDASVQADELNKQLSDLNEKLQIEYENLGNATPEVPTKGFSRKEARDINKMLDNSGIPIADEIKAKQNQIVELRRKQDALQSLSETAEGRQRYEELEDEIFALEDEIAELSGKNYVTESRTYSSLPSLDDARQKEIDNAIDNVINPKPQDNRIRYSYVGEQEPEREMISLLPEDLREGAAYVANDRIDPRYFEYEKTRVPGFVDDSEYDNGLADAFSGMRENVPSPINSSSIPSMNNGSGVRTNDPYTSQHYETMKNSQMFQSAENQAMLEKAKKSGAFDKTVENRKNSMAAALREYTSNPDKVTDEVLNGEWINGGLDVDKSALVINNALNNGDTAMVNLAARREAMKLTNAGRELRAVQDNYVATAEGTIVNGTQFMMKEADKLLNKGGKVATEIKSLAEDAVKSGDATKIAKRFSMNDADFKAIQEALGNGADTEEIAKMIAMHNRLGTTQISDETISSIKQIYDEIEKLGLGVNSKQRAELEADAYKLLAKEIGGNSSLKQKWDAWRYLAMLGNPKTHIRNVLGNTTQYMVTEVKDNVAGAIEGVVDKTSRALGGSGIERQKAILNRASKSDNLLVKLARSDADNEAYRALNEMGSKYNDVSDMMSKNRDAFSTKFMNFLNDKNGNLLEGEDYFGLKNKYSKSLARYLKANGADASIFKATDDNSKALLQKAREYAVDQAKQATFHEYSVMADWLSKTSQNLRYGEKANTFSKLGGAMIESLVPFKKTPVNVLKQGVKYSPISLAKAVTTDAYKLSKGLISASDMIEDLAAGMTGTGILALGYFLSQQGYLSGKGSDEYDVNSAEKRQGKQEYAITIGDKSYTLDWLAPFSLPLFVGTELFNQFENEEYQNKNGLDKILSAIQTIGEPVTEMSMLQGINDALEQLSYSKSSALGTLGGNLATGYITQGVPTLFGQVARSVDDTRRSTYSDQESGFKKQAERAALKSLNKIPGLSTTNEEYRNEWGETEENTGGSVLGRLAYNMFSPGYYADSSRMTDADTELQRLYESTGESAYSDTLSGSITDIGKLDRQTYTEYQKQYGQNNKALVDSLMANSNYDRLDDSEKVDMINNAYKISKAIVDYEIGGKAINKNNQKYYDAYKKDGIKGITDALINNRNATIEKAAKTAQNEKNSQLAMQYGFTKTDDEGNVTGNYSAYEKAKSVYGNDTVGLSQYGNISTQMVNTTGAQITDGFKYSVPYLFAQENMTDEQKGMSLAASKGGIDALSEEAKKMFESDGYSGLYYYYLKKNITGLDKNKDGVISKDEWQKNYDMDKISREFETYLSQFYDMRIQ